MKQYGDITQLHGDALEPVDLIVGGSPCQDLSIAGNRAGLNGERSGLFMEMIRIIREMREKTNGIYPRFALWENVPGAFSSNGGGDFAAVLTEFVRIAEPTAPDVLVPKEKWSKSGILLGDFWSLAWRTHDAQFWGVPQRRKRIALVADFRGRTAPEILFERTSVSGNIEPSGKEREGASESIKGSIDKADIAGIAYAKDVLPFDTTQITSPQNGSKPNYGDPCHSLAAGAHPPSIAVSFQERSGKPGGGARES